LVLGFRGVVRRPIEPEDLAEHLAHKASIGRLFDGRALLDFA
jgi:hypothetical protein